MAHVGAQGLDASGGSGPDLSPGVQAQITGFGITAMLAL